MHPPVRDFIHKQLEIHGQPARVVEVGSRDLNGSIRDLFTLAISNGHDCYYIGVDLRAGASVDHVGDFLDFDQFDTGSRFHPVCIVSCEALEHYPAPQEVVDHAWKLLAAGGLFMGTCAGPGRAPHSGIEATSITPGEYYGNVEPKDLERYLLDAGFDSFEVNLVGSDVQWWALKA